MSQKQINKKLNEAVSSNTEPIQITAQSVPTISEGSANFLSRLIGNDQRFLEFQDKLVIYSLSGSEIGKFDINVKPCVFQNQNCFRVEANSVGVLDDSPCGTKIYAYVNEKMETLEQDYHEYIDLPVGRMDRKTNISLENAFDYTITRTELSQNQVTKQTYTIKKPLMTGFVSESANILIQRLMIQNNKVEAFSMFTFDSEINPCPMSYKPLDSRHISIQDEEINVRGIERTIESISDISTTWQIYFTSDGHMANRIQIGYPAVIKAVEKPKKIQFDEYLPPITIEKKPLNWENDMLLKSEHTDKRESLKNDYDQYLNDNPDLRAIMADFMQSLVSFKPTDVVEFSAKYFAPYSAKTKSNKLLSSLRDNIYIPKH